MRLKGIIALAHLAMLATTWSGVYAAASPADYNAASYHDTAKAAAFEFDSNTFSQQMSAYPTSQEQNGLAFIAIESSSSDGLYGNETAKTVSTQSEPVFDTIRTKTIDTRYFDIKFRFDKYDLDIDYMDNRNILQQLDSILNTIGVENIIKLEIISRSSPEGVYEHNIWLSEKRSATINKFMQDKYPHLTNIMVVYPDGESWQTLRDYVETDSRLNAQSIEKVIQVIDSDINIGTKKWRMENILGKDENVGDIYRYLYRTYYPKIRFSGMTIDHYTETVETIERVPIETIPTITDTTVIVVEPYQPETVVEPTFRRFPKMAVKTNMLYNAMFTPELGYAPILNVELEYYLAEDGRWSILGEYEFPWWVKDSKHQYLQILNLQFEGRYYLKKQSKFRGHYLSTYAGANLYDLCFDSKEGSGIQGEGFHAGFGYGYVLPLNKKGSWKLELFLKGGYYVSHYDKYDAGDPYAGKYYYRWFGNINDFKTRNWRFRWVGPTGAGVTISYDLFYRKKQNK